MKSSKLFKNPFHLAIAYRVTAKTIDFAIALLLALIAYPLGVIAGIAYLSVKDYMSGGQSYGKKFLGFRVVSLIDGTPCSFKQSIVRNLIFIIPYAFTVIPVWGWPFCFLFLVPLVGMEIFFLANAESGHRLGDMLAETTVIANDPTSQVAKKIKTSWFKDEEALPSSVQSSNIQSS